MDGGGPDGSIDASNDAEVDGGDDAGVCELDQRYKFSWQGGNSQLVRHYELQRSGTLRATSIRLWEQDAGAHVCTTTVACENSTKVDLSELRVALKAPTVVSAFGDGTRTLGEDRTPVDGPSFVIEREDGDKIVIGAPCGATPNCVAIPPAVESLRTLVLTLIQEQSGSADAGVGSCAAP